MHRKPKNEEIRRLIQVSAEARKVLAEDFDSFRDRFSPRARIQNSVRTRPLPWLGGTAVLGWVTSRLFRGKSKSRSKKHQAPPEPATTAQKGLLLTLVGLALTALRPMAQTWITDQVRQYLANRFSYGSTTRPRPMNFRPSNPL